MVVFGNVGLTVVASVLLSLLPLGGSVVWSLATGNDEPN